MKYQGCYTALITPFGKFGFKPGYDGLGGLSELVQFQISQGVSGILACGTTGESPTLNWDGHIKLIFRVKEVAGEQCQVIAGTGSNSTEETLKATCAVTQRGRAAIDSVLLVDPYYNGPSSLEIRREYLTPVAEQFPTVDIIPYIIPGRTGTQLLPEDLGLLHKQYPNVCAVKEATGDLPNAARIRRCCGDKFDILSGDDDKTFEMMISDVIKASGVISVVSNVAPAAVQQMTQYLLAGEREKAENIQYALAPLFGIVTVKTEEETEYGRAICKARNPLPIKTLMNILGMPSGPCIQPLGKMTRLGLEKVVAAARTVHQKHPKILEPIEYFFGVNAWQRLTEEEYWQGLYYEEGYDK